jgi:tetratricopeptide (TPR) repeat protein
MSKKEKETKKTQPKTVLNNPQGTIITNLGTVIYKYFDEKILKRYSVEQRIGFFILFFTVIVVGISLFLALRPNQKDFMTGEFRIAIAAFAENGRSLPDDIGYTVADGINIRLGDDLREITVGPKVEIWGPDKIGTVKGKSPEDRAENAGKLASKIRAHMVIYGVVEETPNGMIVVPEFYLDTQGFHEGSEVIGQYELGSPFPLPGADNPAWAYDFDREMQTRSDIISSLSIGLSYFAIHEYEKSLEVLQSIESIDNWEEDQGKETLYALIGFAAGKAKQYELTESALEKAIKINPDYARPYIGMANLNYILALQPFEKSKDPADVDQKLLDKCFAYLEKAEEAPEKPPLAEAETKIHFSRGQCLWLKTYTGELPDFSLSVKEFEAVIASYDDGNNPRVRELVAESHARLGLIYRLTGDQPHALENYQIAVDLLDDIPERQAQFQERADEIEKLLLESTPTK